MTAGAAGLRSPKVSIARRRDASSPEAAACNNSRMSWFSACAKAAHTENPQTKTTTNTLGMVGPFRVLAEFRQAVICS